MIWLSWADDDGFNGGCFVPCDDVVEGTAWAIAAGCRPEKGGQVLAVPAPDALAVGWKVGVLYSQADLEAAQ